MRHRISSVLTSSVRGVVRAALALVYAFLVVSSLAAPGGLDILTSGGGVTLSALSKAFADPATMAAGWAHYVCFDLFVGRWVWADGLRNRVRALGSLDACCHAGLRARSALVLVRSLLRNHPPPARDPPADGGGDE